MPKETFFNLPEEKRQFIVEISVKEFGSNGYDKASINRIVENANIAKGSFYQYFNDKKDLFLYLISQITEKKIDYMSPVLKNPEQYDFFTLIKELYVSGLKFAAENRELSKLGNWLLNNSNHPVFGELLDSAIPKSQNVYTGLLYRAIEKGEIRADIDVDFISNTITSLSISMMEYYYQTHEGIDFGSDEFSDGVIKSADKMLDFIKGGLKK